MKKQTTKPVAQSASQQDRRDSSNQRPADPASADDTLTRRMPGHEVADAAVLADSRRHTRRAFAGAALGTAAAYGFWRYIQNSPGDQMLPRPLRRALNANAALSRGLFREHALAPTYPLSRAETLRINGIAGLKQDLLLDSWRLQLVGMRDAAHHPRYVQDVTTWQYQYRAADAHEDKGHDTKFAPKAKTEVAPKADTADKMTPALIVGDAKAKQAAPPVQPMRGQEEAGESDSALDPNTPGLLLTLDDLAHLPRHELITQFKCIEGWSQIVHWAGIRMSDFLDAYPPANINGAEPKYVYMETPNGDFYTGYDMDVMRHPQTLLVTEMMGQPLTQNHGAPLRLHMPTKYGYKQIKRIGLISYMNDKPDDYWTKLGYDWYAGL